MTTKYMTKKSSCRVISVIQQIPPADSACTLAKTGYVLAVFLEREIDGITFARFSPSVVAVELANRNRSEARALEGRGGNKAMDKEK